MITESVSAKIGLYFTAIDKLGNTYKYRLVGINKDCKMREYQLWNITLSEKTEVEQQWFEERKITDIHT